VKLQTIMTLKKNELQQRTKVVKAALMIFYYIVRLFSGLKVNLGRVELFTGLFEVI